MIFKDAHKPLISKALIFLLGLLLVPALIAACGGGSDEPREHISFGRALDVLVTEPELQERMVLRVGRTCNQESSFRLLEVTNPNRTYVAIHVRVANRTSALVPLFVNSESAQLGDPRTDRIYAVDPCKVGKEYDAPGGGEEVTHSPLLWSNIELRKGFEVRGWMFFDVPKALPLTAFWWQDPETQTIDYTREQYAN